MHGSSLTCLAWHSQRMQLFLSSHSLTTDLTQAGPSPSFWQKRGINRFPRFTAFRGTESLDFTNMYKEAEYSFVCVTLSLVKTDARPSKWRSQRIPGIVITFDPLDGGPLLLSKESGSYDRREYTCSTLQCPSSQ